MQCCLDIGLKGRKVNGGKGAGPAKRLTGYICNTNIVDQTAKGGRSGVGDDWSNGVDCAACTIVGSLSNTISMQNTAVKRDICLRPGILYGSGIDLNRDVETSCVKDSLVGN